MSCKDTVFKDKKMKKHTILTQNRHTDIKQSPAKKLAITSGIIMSFCLLSPNVLASKLTYTPVNPTFGGNALNTTHLFSRAEAINDYEDDSSSSSTSTIDSLVSSLQSRLLSELISNGETGSLVTDDYTLNITDDGDGGLTLSIIDALTGETTTIQVSGLN